MYERTGIRAAESLNSVVSTSFSVFGFQKHSAIPRFAIDTGYPNSGPCVCIVGTLPRE